MAVIPGREVTRNLHATLSSTLRNARGKAVALPHHMATTTWQPVTLVKCVSVKPWLLIPGDDEPGGCHDLTLGKIYECLGVEGRGSFMRIVDDSGKDYLYPLSHFKEV